MKRMFLAILAAVCLVVLALPLSPAQVFPAEQTFPQSKTAVESASRQLQSSSGGRLPVLDGFVISGSQPLDRFRRGYYQCTVEVESAASGGSVVRVRAEITAWYTDPVAAKSGYQVLPSNGRLESDYLDRLAEMLSEGSSQASGASPANRPPKNETKDARVPAISAPTRELPSAPSSEMRVPGAGQSALLPTKKTAADQRLDELDKEAKSLEEILHNQSHPNNLVAVKTSGTPVLASPIEGAKTLFLADAEDEFEMLETNTSWVHVRISGLSRGWIRRSALEMPDASASEDTRPEMPSMPSPVVNTSPLQIESEQIASFPANWEPLRGRTVMIVSVQKTADSNTDAGSQSKLGFAKSVFEKEYAELVKTSSTAAGIVLIFDSADGGMLAATLPVLKQWKAGTLSDEALWRRCYFDPPELFRGSR
jgi:hypothetical protein